MAKKKMQRGGARPGAGRKVGPDGPAVVIAASVPQTLADALDAYAKENGHNRSEAVTLAILGLVGRRKPVAKK